MRTFTVFGALTLAGALTACAGSQSGPAFSPGTISARSTERRPLTRCLLPRAA